MEEKKNEGETALLGASPIDQKEILSAVAEVLEILRRGEQDALTPEQLALPLKPFEVRAVVGLVRATPFSRWSLYTSRR